MTPPRAAIPIAGSGPLGPVTERTRRATLDTGPYKRGAFLAHGSFAVAHHTDLWLWSPPSPPLPRYSAYAMAPDGSHAVGNTWEVGFPVLLRISDRREAPVTCLQQLRLYQLSRVHARLAVDARGRVLFIDEAGQVCMNDVFHDVEGAAVRRPTSFSIEAAAAYSPSGAQFAVGLAGRTLLVLTSPDDPGRELAPPEEARGLAFIDEHELVALGESGALMRIDLVLGEAVVMHRDWLHATAPTRASATASGEAVIFSGAWLFLQPADPVPKDSPGLQAWLRPRTR